MAMLYLFALYKKKTIQFGNFTKQQNPSKARV